MATIGGVIYPAAGPAHTVKDTQQAKVGTNPKDRVSVLALAGAVQNLNETVGMTAMAGGVAADDSRLKPSWRSSR